jgi:MFS family permease
MTSARRLPAPDASDARGDLTSREHVALGLRANWQQFALLVVVNAFVGAMVGLERSVLPVLATREFRVTSTTAILLFIATFGLTKAFTNLASGWLADRGARRRALVAGWLVGVPVPLLILYAPSWWWVVAANALLGVNQGLAWSMTVIMKIDLVGAQRRGLAMGLNEFAGYGALAVASGGSGFVAAQYGLREGTAFAGLAIAGTGLLLSLLVRDTRDHVELELQAHAPSTSGGRGQRPGVTRILARSLWPDAGLFSVSQAGLVNNLNDGLAWGVFPLLFLSSGLSLREMSILASIYPAVWSVAQLATGPLSDRWGRKVPVVVGMIVQGAALVAIGFTHTVAAWSVALVLLGLGTALVYPALLAAVGDLAHPSWRGTAVGVYRLWRDLGYVAGALLAGIVADLLGTSTAIVAVGVLTGSSGVFFAIRFQESRGRA